MKRFILVAIIAAAGFSTAAAAIDPKYHSTDAQCNADADNYARRQLANHYNNSAGYDYWYDSYELENCPGAGIDD